MIRDARRARGWSQAALAVKLGVSQSLISRVERGLQALEPVHEQRLFKLLGVRIHRPEPTRIMATLVEPRLPRSTGRLPLRITEWQRRRPSGDFLIVVPSRESVLLGFGDVAGNGPRVATLAHYVEGWLRGAMVGQERGISMVIAEDLEAELLKTEIDLAYFLAIVRRENTSAHRVTIEYVRRGMPAPLLFQGMPSASRALGEDRELVHVSAPWRIVAASDGLLHRLGSGDETVGLQHIARWQSSEQRDQPAERRFGSEVDTSIDESLWIVEWSGWDIEIGLNARDDRERELLYYAIKAVSQDAATAVAEIVLNSLRHGYRDRGGEVWVRLRRGDLGTFIEIEDHGAGGLTQAKLETSNNGLAVVRGLASCVTTRNAYPTGTIVTIMFTPPGEKR